MRQDFPDRPLVGDKADQPDIATTVGTRHRKLLTHTCQQPRLGNTRRIVVARLSINDSSRTAAAATRGSQGTGMLARHRGPLLAKIPDGNRRDRWPQRMVRRKHPVIPVPVPPGRWNQVLPAGQETQTTSAQ
jgi:hypothetical protein